MILLLKAYLQTQLYFFVIINKKSISNQQALSNCIAYSQNLNINYENVINTAPIFNIGNLILGFLGGVNSKCFTSFSGSNKMSDIMSLLATQNAKTFICESDLLTVQLPDVICF